ncbi:transmembrane protein, putative [Medicago truncatula]|uniref:Transmembrane protein, putative n=1 Tax=Medicago truncatula TaxID=3880 RepID=G7L3S7_MEDTR|nr:transmembrane protein, putative [Medicago truncatula]
MSYAYGDTKTTYMRNYRLVALPYPDILIVCSIWSWFSCHPMQPCEQFSVIVHY